ncbi:transcriptional regulator [Piscinibacterium candidicorallinum]|jgi:transcriptional regulator with XRE-family HTH domain|uniref:Transcriptional regulator n=1 Tax=Piscinibacterium candidicorallinum TaxID=1793872 RepID=A0ABV7H811_9BURK
MIMMDTHSIPTPEAYEPSRLLEYLKSKLALPTDAALAAQLGVQRAVLSRIRNRKADFGAALLIRIHELTDIPTKELRRIMGDRRGYFRMPHDQRVTTSSRPDGLPDDDMVE